MRWLTVTLLIGVMIAPIPVGAESPAALPLLKGLEITASFSCVDPELHINGLCYGLVSPTTGFSFVLMYRNGQPWKIWHDGWGTTTVLWRAPARCEEDSSVCA